MPTIKRKSARKGAATIAQRGSSRTTAKRNPPQDFLTVQPGSPKRVAAKRGPSKSSSAGTFVLAAEFKAARSGVTTIVGNIVKKLGATKSTGGKTFRAAINKRVTLAEAAISAEELSRMAEHLSDTQRAAIEAARARAKARLRRPDMSAEALRERERAGAEWEAHHGPVSVFAGTRRQR
ncbi:hypothetical protein KDX32_14760 [Burkholderia ambifaria]|uniref:hypothetical protein n=1 Tax=Burkholderia ambifaria TaxID=152480 RepID=UPI001B961201|nr:hypothetical protein [Burkholderia ambifaria]MBR8064348.1 hypothetical protein [Burkholderia ambifaria]